MYMSKLEAEEVMRSANGRTSVLSQGLTQEYKNLKLALQSKFFNLSSQIEKQRINDKKKYQIDYNFGLILYETLFQVFGEDFSMRVISNNDFWIYLSVRVIPNIVAERWGIDNHTRFYEMDRRIWLSNLWWYVHLSWQGKLEDTKKILEVMNTDTILNLVERPSREGYDTTLSRSIMKHYYLWRKNKHKDQGNRDVFRLLLVQNTFYLKTIEPGSFKHIDDYVKFLFKSIGEEIEEVY